MTKKFVSNKDETVRMFESDFLEAFSKVHWSVPLYLFIPVILYFLYRGIFIYHLTALTIIGMVIAGIFFWSFAEYFLHRYLFHFHPKSDLGKRLIWMFHGVHHDYPSDSKRLVMPPSASIPLATLFYLLFLLVLGPVLTAPFFAGFITGYLFYDITHYAIHHFNVKSKFFLALKKHHTKHHYQNPDLGYGVSQKTWDYIFHTNFPSTKK